MSQRGDTCAYPYRSTVSLALARVPGLTVNPPAQLFFFARVRCTRAIRKRYFLIGHEGSRRTKAPKNEVLGSKVNPSNWPLMQTGS